MGEGKISDEPIMTLLQGIRKELSDIKLILILAGAKATTTNGAKLITQNELAQVLGVSDRQIRRMLSSKKKK